MHLSTFQDKLTNRSWLIFVCRGHWSSRIEARWIMAWIFYSLALFQVPFFISQALYVTIIEKKKILDVTTTPTLRWGCSVAVLQPFKTVMYVIKTTGKRIVEKALYLQHWTSRLSLDFNGIFQIHQSQCRTSTARKSKDSCNNSNTMTLIKNVISDWFQQADSWKVVRQDSSTDVLPVVSMETNWREKCL